MIKLETTKNFERFCKNVERVDALCMLYEQNKGELGKRSTDILRSAVVFLHASQEDYYRSTLVEMLPVAGSKDTLNKIALAESDGRAEKFALGSLIDFSDMSIDELIQRSVRQQMGRTSFNSYSDIVTWMRSIDIDLGSFNKQGLLENLIKRRHRIVHEVDNVASDRKSTSSIDIRTVTSWKDAVLQLIKLVDEQVVIAKTAKTNRNR